MNKKGFIFVESIIVLMVVALSVAMLIASYSLISRKTKEKENYDKASDKYLLYAISNMGTDDNNNYATVNASIATCPGCAKLTFEVDKDNCDEGTMVGNKKHYNNKVGYFMKNCSKVFEDLNIEHLYVVDNIRNTLNDYKSNDSDEKYTDNNRAVYRFTPGTIEYMKSLKKCNDDNSFSKSDTGEITYVNNNKETDKCNNPITYLIAEFLRGEVYYYASIQLGDAKTINSESNVKKGWVLESNSRFPINKQKWVFYDSNGERLMNGIYYIRNGSQISEYYFDEYGYMYTGWYKPSGGDIRYYTNADPDNNCYLNGFTTFPYAVIDGVEKRFEEVSITPSEVYDSVTGNKLTNSSATTYGRCTNCTGNEEGKGLVTKCTYGGNTAELDSTGKCIKNCPTPAVSHCND